MFWAAWALFVTALYAVACVLASRRLPLEPPLWADAPPVSVIKPVRGLDPGAEANFRSFFRQRYPSAFELIFACESEDDPAVPLLRRLMEEHPEVPARLVLAPPRPNLTGKMANVAAAYRHARHPLLVISDSDMRVGPDFLHRLVSPLADDRVGLVGTLPVYIDADGLPAQALQVYAHLFSLCFGAVIADVQLPGKFAAGNQAMRRDLAEALGGFESLGRFITEDVQLSNAAREGGRRVVYAAMADVPVGRPNRREVVETLTRYLMGSRAMSLPLFAFTCLLNLGHWLTPAAGLALGRADLAALGLLPVATRMAVAWHMHRRWAGPCRPAGKVLAALALDGMFLEAAVRVLLGRPVSWRGVRYRVDRAGRVHREDAMVGGENAPV
ncbi:MAG: glycosyltransferase [Thermaerobacter sp.]|nr:hypothetical protein [Bacillota bacterium]REJ37011.1 MAG: hypothetical protein DIU84_05095 [Bacillota bacterium]